MMSYTGMKMNDLHLWAAAQMSPINIMVSGTLLTVFVSVLAQVGGGSGSPQV